MANRDTAQFLDGFEGKDSGFFLKDRKKGEVFEIETETGHTYGVFVADPQTGFVLLVSSDHELLVGNPSWAYLKGSTAGGSTLWLGRIGKGLRAEFWLIDYRTILLLSETVETYWIAPDGVE